MSFDENVLIKLRQIHTAKEMYVQRPTFLRENVLSAWVRIHLHADLLQTLSVWKKSLKCKLIIYLYNYVPCETTWPASEDLIAFRVLCTWLWLSKQFTTDTLATHVKRSSVRTTHRCLCLLLSSSILAVYEHFLGIFHVELASRRNRLCSVDMSNWLLFHNTYWEVPSSVPIVSPSCRIPSSIRVFRNWVKMPFLVVVACEHILQGPDKIMSLSAF